MDLLAAGTAGHVQYGELSELFGLANETSIPCLQVRPRPRHYVLAVVIHDDLAPFAHLSGCEVDRNLVSTPSLWLRESSSDVHTLFGLLSEAENLDDPSVPVARACSPHSELGGTTTTRRC
jgi:hypothetical protein